LQPKPDLFNPVLGRKSYSIARQDRFANLGSVIEGKQRNVNMATGNQGTDMNTYKNKIPI